MIRVPVVRIVWRELVVPLQLAGIRVEGEERTRVQIVAFAIVAVIVGIRIASAPVQQIEGRIIAACDPGAAATSGDDVGRGPRLTAPLAGRWHGIEAPHPCAGPWLVRIDEAARRIVAAGNADD